MVLVVLSVAAVPFAAAQAPPSTLLEDVPALYLGSGDALLRQLGNGSTGAACPDLQIVPPTTTGSQTFSLDLRNGNGSYYVLSSQVRVDLAVVAANPSAPATSGTGVLIEGVLRHGNNTLATAAPIEVQANDATAKTLAFTLPNVTAAPGALSLTVTITGVQPAPPLPVPSLANYAIQCDATGSGFEPFQIVRGIVGDLDTDGDGAPDSDDPDDDNDGVPDNQENVQCQLVLGGETVNMGKRNDLQPNGDRDGDGKTDGEECAMVAQGNAWGPLDSALPAPPPAFPWDMLIFIVVVLLVLAALVFLFLKFGHVVTLSVVSQSQAIIQPGKGARYELVAESSFTKGDPVTIQLMVAGMPEGWDAKLSVDHVTLARAGEAEARKPLQLTVEAPEHSDPESAVVVVKAVPLNKQGRKDTLKKAAKAQTITSINIPPDAQVPVKRGAPIKMKTGPSEEGASAPAAVPAGGLPVSSLAGVTAAQAKKLETAGVKTTEDLAAADAAEIAKKTKLGESDVAKWQGMCTMLRLPRMTPEFAEALVGAGILSTRELSNMKPEVLVERVNAYLASKGAA